MKNQEFVNTLFAMEPIGMEDDPIGDQGGGEIIYDDIDSSKTMNEEIVDFMTRNIEDELSEEGGMYWNRSGSVYWT